MRDVRLTDIELVGGKNASLGQMISQLKSQGIRVPEGFAITSQAYWYYLYHNNLTDRIQELIAQIGDGSNLSVLRSCAKQLRELLESAQLPADLEQAIVDAYHDLCVQYNVAACDVAVRSSATAEDLPDASFAGQQDTYLNVTGTEQLLLAYKKCIASLFNDRAIIYRIQNNYDHFSVALSVGVQKMVRADKACSGVLFTLDTETGFKDMITITGAYGLGESIVQGSVTPDEYAVFKPTFAAGFKPLVKKQLGDKHCKTVYVDGQGSLTHEVAVAPAEQKRFCLTDEEILTLAGYAMVIEKHYSELNGKWTPMDIEWAKDGIDGHVYIVQARPETVHSGVQDGKYYLYSLHKSKGDAIRVLVEGHSIGQKIAHGRVCIMDHIDQAAAFKDGDVLVTSITDPDWLPLMKKASALITERGGRTSHAAIVSRELGIPAIVGASGARTALHNGQEITVDCSQGAVGYAYQGFVPFASKEIDMNQLSKPPVDILVNIADPDRALAIGQLPVNGVGLARMEFIISNAIKVHPMALLFPERVTDANVRAQIDDITFAYPNKADFFVDSLAQGIAAIAAAFYPRQVIVRTSDFKSNEYFNLVGGSFFELQEENPMLGLRGASRYYHPNYAPAFVLECAALKKVRDQMGLDNVTVMLPFVRTVDEAQKVLDLMADHGLARGQNGLQVYMMCEIPSNVILIEDFSKLFDGFSIGSNDLTQTTLACDRDSSELMSIFDERNKAVTVMLEMAITGANRMNTKIGICGQAPSDHPEIADFLIKTGIKSMSLNPDSVIPFLLRLDSAKQS